MNDNIYTRVKKLREKINRIGLSVNKNIDDIKLVAVSKTQPFSKIVEARQAGINFFGENKVQELQQKIEAGDSNFLWHFIGHLQTNKVKYIYDKISLIHSVDSVRLAEKISQLSIGNNKVTNILLQVNTSDEENKFGFSLNEIFENMNKISKLPNLNIQGLMTMAPFTNEISRISASFSKLRGLSEIIVKQKIENIDMKYLSMGMSNDYEIAIKEGSNMLRIGTLIFGARN